MLPVLSQMLGDAEPSADGVFPLHVIPSIPWQNVPGSRNTHFGAPRTEINPQTNTPYPTHGACDLIAPEDTPVYAVADGEVWKRGWFYDSWVVTQIKPGVNKVVCHRRLFDLVIVHDFFIARYSEISEDIPTGMSLKTGTKVSKGQHIAFVGPNCAEYQMLHFEMFADVSRRDDLSTEPGTKYLYVPQREYQRRSDLLDPTPFLDRWADELRQQQFTDRQMAADALKGLQSPYQRPPAPRPSDI